MELKEIETIANSLGFILNYDQSEKLAKIFETNLKT